MRRIFIAIKTSESLEKEIINWQSDKLNWPVRWLEPKNLHLTLVPPWDCSDISLVIDKLSKIDIKNKSIDISYHLIDFGPNPANFRLIWAIGDYNLELENLKNKLEEKLEIKETRRRFLPHLTLARFKKLPPVKLKEEISWLETQDCFVLFQSILSSSGAQYNILKKFKF